MVGNRLSRTKTAESALRFSAKARSRIYAPEGLFNHHHASQFVTLSPPMDVNHRWPVEFSHERDDNSSVTADSDPHLKARSIGSSSSTRLSSSDPSVNISQLSSRAGSSSPRRTRATPTKSYPLDSTSAEEKKEDPPQRRSIGNIVSKLNCSRCRRDGKQINLGSSSGSVIMTLTEEQQQRWMSSFDITGPIAEDVSVAGHSTQSGVSMSATPLLNSQARHATALRGSSRRPENSRMAAF